MSSNARESTVSNVFCKCMHGLSTHTEHPQNSRSYFVSSKPFLNYHYVHSMA